MSNPVTRRVMKVVGRAPAVEKPRLPDAAQMLSALPVPVVLIEV